MGGDNEGTISTAKFEMVDTESTLSNWIHVPHLPLPERHVEERIFPLRQTEGIGPHNPVPGSGGLYVTSIYLGCKSIIQLYHLMKI